jgi:hypothetical protein
VNNIQSAVSRSCRKTSILSQATPFLVAALAVVVGSAATPLLAYSATYQLSPTGNDSNSGLTGSPWRTIQKAANSVAPGDTVVINAGTYNEEVTLTRSGTAAAPITFRAASPLAILDGTGLPGGSGAAAAQLINTSDVSYVKLDGLTIKNSPGWGIYVGGNSSHIEMTNLDVSSCRSNGIFVNPTGTAPNFTIVRNSQVHDNGSGGITIWVAPGGYFLVENNVAYNNAGAGNYDGIQVGGGDGATHHVVVRGNVAYGNGVGTTGADQIDLGGHAHGDHYLVEDNEARGPGGDMKVQQAYNATGIIARRNRLTGGVGFVVYGFPTPAVYYNNTIVDAGHALQFWSDRADSPPGRSLGGFEFRNNLVLQSTNYLFLLNGVTGYLIDITYPSMRLANNMYKFTGKGIGWMPRIFDCQNADPSGASEFAAYQVANAPDLQDVGSRRTTAALTSIFVDPASRDYHLKSGSPAIDAGAPLTSTTNAGTNSTVVALVRSDYFQDGYSGLIAPDSVVVGKNPPVPVIKVDEVGKTITLRDPITWNKGDSVSLPFNGTAPDVGAYETGIASPTLISVEPVN